MNYTGVGSRKTPLMYQYLLSIIAVGMGSATLRSGGAVGADTAFENGAKNKEIYLPYKGFNDNPSELYLGRLYQEDLAVEIASSIHPAWNRCDTKAKQYHTRNVYQVLGLDLESPSDMLICWTPDAANGTTVPTSRVSGGTGTAIKLAAVNEIPVFNIADENSLRDVVGIIGKDKMLDILQGLSDIIPDGTRNRLTLLISN